MTRHSEANKEQQRQRLESAHTALRDAEARAAAAGAAADAARRELEVRLITVLRLLIAVVMGTAASLSSHV